jgi:hypothetical protein
MKAIENIVEWNELGISNQELTQVLKFTYLYLLIRFKLHYRQVSIITHTDFDGAVSAAILLQRYPYGRLYCVTPSILHKVLYVVKAQSAPDIPLDLFILDLGITPDSQSRVLRAIKVLREKILAEVFWVDHHENTEVEDIKKYVRAHIDSHVPHTAYLVQRLLYDSGGMGESDCRKINVLLSILENGQTPFVRYWNAVLKETSKQTQREMTVAVIQTLAKFKHTKLTDKLYKRALQRATPPEDLDKPQILQTQQGYRFFLFNFQNDTELYPKVRELLTKHQLDFVVVSFEDGTLSIYKNRLSLIDLRPVFALVDGKGHDYAFHFVPQIRISDEFYRPVNLTDLVSKVQEVV